MIVEMRCPNCRETNEIKLDDEKYDRWISGEHVQNVWPEKTPAEREQLITGICSDKCWNEYLGPELD